MTTMGTTPPDEPNPTPATEPQAAPPSAVGTLSPDGRWVWDGQAWRAAMAPPGMPPGMAAAGPAPGVRYAGLWIRVLAYVIDSVILSVIGFVVTRVVGSPFTILIDPVTNQIQTVNWNGGAQLVLTFVGLCYFAGFWGLQGQTPGQRALGLRVVRARDGAPPGLVPAFIRGLGMLISTWAFFLGLLWVAWDPRKQGWHDKIAGTFVVRSVAQP